MDRLVTPLLPSASGAFAPQNKFFTKVVLPLIFLIQVAFIIANTEIIIQEKLQRTRVYPSFRRGDNFTKRVNLVTAREQISAQLLTIFISSVTRVFFRFMLQSQSDVSYANTLIFFFLWPAYLSLYIFPTLIISYANKKILTRMKDFLASIIIKERTI